MLARHPNIVCESISLSRKLKKERLNSWLYRANANWTSGFYLRALGFYLRALKGFIFLTVYS